MQPTINQMVLNLLEATVTLYPANADGAPRLDSPIWMGAAAENLVVRAAWLNEKTRPSGAKYPRRHPLVAEYQVNIGRVWVVDQTGALNGFIADHQPYVLDVTWVDEDTQQWHRKTFYGVTISEQDWDARDIESGLMENQQFEAQYFVPDSGSTATPPDISQSLPYWVQYVGANEVVTLYTYDPASRSFTVQADTNGRAVIGYTNGAFGVQFATDDFPVMATSGPASLPYRSGAIYRNANTYRQSALLVNGGIFTGVSLETPRLDFYYGNQRVFTVSRNGVFDLDFAEGGVGSADGGVGAFGILGGGALVAVCGRGRLTATQFRVSA